MTPNRPRPRHILHIHHHGLTSRDARYPQALDLLATISARVQAIPPDAAIADVTGAERYFERGPEGLAQLIRLRTLAWTGAHTTIGAGGSLMLATMAAAVTEPGGITVVPRDLPDGLLGGTKLAQRARTVLRRRHRHLLDRADGCTRPCPLRRFDGPGIRLPPAQERCRGRSPALRRLE
jgi:hypothetical protein